VSSPCKSPKPSSSLQQFHQRIHQAAQGADALGNEAEIGSLAPVKEEEQDVEEIGGLAPNVRLLNRKVETMKRNFRIVFHIME
jgi:hypothetical protein